MTRKTLAALSAYLLVLLTACSTLPPRPPMSAAYAAPPAADGVLAQHLAPAEARHAGKSGFRLLSNGTEAYASRMFSAQVAARSLDIQTYIWHADMTGKMLAQRALAAADRGVQVRILVDDMDARAKNAGFAALDAHPRIEVRVFNPFASRSGTLSRIGELGTGFRRLNHRMHNKSWIADNRIALVGGRNLGDEYFGASENSNFVDLDVLMAGPVVREVSASFDRFWNAPSNYPIDALNAGPATPEALAQVRAVLEATPAELAASPYAQVLREDADVQRLIIGDTALHWTREWTFVSDDPLKLDDEHEPLQRSAVLATLLPAIRGTRQTLGVISPYFVPGRKGTDDLLAAARGGVDVRVLTNSLAATDVAAVHGGYARYRDELLAGGVQLWELKPDGTASSSFSLRGSSGSSLHTKALVIDQHRAFVGSYNLDPRSTALNTEQGVLITDPRLAQELTRIFEERLQGQHAWHVQRVDGRLRWSDGSQTWTHDPQASTSRRVQAWLTKLLPVESQL
ncbi:phosphatidylserine/phosphatidylglycerophosphate/cardiolipin synthase family protein [Lysobacter cavernae]|uniref:Phosphatidylserine/phosphatidylglycerophosphate/ cardiolipin synthase family protein n=1 Tax=Lysobacter cavernae TaxID=1685901 RepID=A0ABV7RRV6_9GAMM